MPSLPAAGPHRPDLVRVSVRSLGARELCVTLKASDSVADLRASVEQQVGLEWLQEVALLAGAERLQPGTSMRALVERSRGGDVCVQAVKFKSVSKAVEAWGSKELSEFLLVPLRALQGGSFPMLEYYESHEDCFDKYSEAFQLIIDEGHTVSMPAHRAGVEYIVSCLDDPCCPKNLLRFTEMIATLELTELHAGRRSFRRPVDWFQSFIQMKRGRFLLEQDVFTEPVVALIKQPSFLQDLGNACGDILPSLHFQDILDWLSEKHPQQSVRAAALEVAGGYIARARDAPAVAAAPERGAPAGAATREPAGASSEQEADATAVLSEEEVDRVAAAIDCSNTEWQKQEVAWENEQVTEALLRSKLDFSVGSGVVLARLPFHTPKLLELLRTSHHLENSRRRVADKGCELSPPFANGALLLEPATEEQIDAVGIRLAKHHILMPSGDVDAVEQVLQEWNRAAPRRSRVKAEWERFPEGKGQPRADGQEAEQAPSKGRNRAHEQAPSKGLAPAKGQPRAGEQELEPAPSQGQPYASKHAQALSERTLVIERTFISFPDRHNISEASAAVADSAPACPGEAPCMMEEAEEERIRAGIGSGSGSGREGRGRGVNPHRWRLQA